MAERAIVWAVRLGLLDQAETKGTLALEPDAISFVPETSGADIRIPFADVRRVTRSIGSPVLIVERSSSAVAFYFAEPPPLRFRSEVSRKTKGRLRAISYLRGRNRTKREQVKQWVERIREAVSNG